MWRTLSRHVATLLARLSATLAEPLPALPQPLPPPPAAPSDCKLREGSAAARCLRDSSGGAGGDAGSDDEDEAGAAQSGARGRMNPQWGPDEEAERARESHELARTAREGMLANRASLVALQVGLSAKEGSGRRGRGRGRRVGSEKGNRND